MADSTLLQPRIKLVSVMPLETPRVNAFRDKNQLELFGKCRPDPELGIRFVSVKKNGTVYRRFKPMQDYELDWRIRADESIRQNLGMILKTAKMKEAKQIISAVTEDAAKDLHNEAFSMQSTAAKAKERLSSLINELMENSTTINSDNGRVKKEYLEGITEKTGVVQDKTESDLDFFVRAEKMLKARKDFASECEKAAKYICKLTINSKMDKGVPDMDAIAEISKVAADLMGSRNTLRKECEELNQRESGLNTLQDGAGRMQILRYKLSYLYNIHNHLEKNEIMQVFDYYQGELDYKKNKENNRAASELLANKQLSSAINFKLATAIFFYEK